MFVVMHLINGGILVLLYHLNLLVHIILFMVAFLLLVLVLVSYVFIWPL